jgi:hypothetical protein
MLLRSYIVVLGPGCQKCVSCDEQPDFSLCFSDLLIGAKRGYLIEKCTLYCLEVKDLLWFCIYYHIEIEVALRYSVSSLYLGLLFNYGDEEANPR